eukprot:760147_1
MAGAHENYHGAIVPNETSDDGLDLGRQRVHGTLSFAPPRHMHTRVILPVLAVSLFLRSWDKTLVESLWIAAIPLVIADMVKYIVQLGTIPVL